jgi:hypothetical protein
VKEQDFFAWTFLVKIFSKQLGKVVPVCKKLQGAIPATG